MIKKVILLFLALLSLPLAFAQTSWERDCYCDGFHNGVAQQCIGGSPSNGATGYYDNLNHVYSNNPNCDCDRDEEVFSCTSSQCNNYNDLNPDTWCVTWTHTDCDTCHGFLNIPYGCNCKTTTYRNCHMYEYDASGDRDCYCYTNYGNCDNNKANGCETRIDADSNNCGANCNDCGDAPCVSGSCGNDDTWASCEYSCAGGNLIECLDGCSGVKSTNLPSSSDVKYQSVNQECGVIGTVEAFCKCDSSHLDCSSGSNGCESSKTSIRTCGSCGNDCADLGCSGATFLGIGKNDAGYFDTCGFNCGSGSQCSGYTLSEGFCSSNADCKSGLKCQKDIIQEDFNNNWCCSANQCGHEQACYDKYSDLKIEDNVYVCVQNDAGIMEWVDFSTTIHFGKYLQYENGQTILTGEVHLANTGITNECAEDNYAGCVQALPHYAYQYCSEISAVFDGMFNLELGQNVPVLVSEQNLYDPYSPSYPVFQLEGCSYLNNFGPDIPNDEEVGRLKC